MQTNIIIVTHCTLEDNSGIQNCHLAQSLCDLGFDCVIAAHGDLKSPIHQPKFRTAGYDRLDLAFANGRPADIVHAWTPREGVRRACEVLALRNKCPIVVHLEDNEDFVTQSVIGVEAHHRAAASTYAIGDHLVPRHLTHPRRGWDFVATSAGVTGLFDTLREFVPSYLPFFEFWPGFDPAFVWAAGGKEERRLLGIEPSDIAIVYSGNAHPANKSDVLSLYDAVRAARQRGIPYRLVRTGRGQVLDRPVLPEEGIVELGWVQRERLVRLFSAADVFVQPGNIDDFNRYRFPSKVPDMMVTGKPVILPKANIGLHLTNNSQAILLEDTDAAGLLTRLEWLADHRTEGVDIGRRGRHFALQTLNWTAAAKKLSAFYADIISGKASRGPILPGNMLKRRLRYIDDARRSKVS